MRSSKKGMNYDANKEPLRIVSIGGGTGLSTLLRGLKRYARVGAGAVDITAVVTVTDDGGSSGRLRRDFDVLPPGDIRNCMVALSEDEALLSKLFQYRFTNGGGLKGHSFGNLFLTAMTHLTGDFHQAVRFSGEVLAVLGNIYPSTEANVVIEATLANGRKVAGETRISRSRSRIEKIEIHPRRPKPLPETLDAIAKADLITLGPGSLFTSVIPNLLVEGIPKAIAESRATKAYFLNLMSQPGETTNFRASDHVAAIYRHAKRPVLDVCVVNSHPIRGRVLDRYEANAAKPVENDLDNLEKMGLKVVEADLLRMYGNQVQEKIRHDSSVIAAIALELARKAHKRKWTKK
ncbi:MAG TPA: YvcK family protein [Bryobacteraceae bacterium]|nr:YvcK family protein [Bryobacteraceae bacterium]